MPTCTRGVWEQHFEADCILLQLMLAGPDSIAKSAKEEGIDVSLTLASIYPTIGG